MILTSFFAMIFLTSLTGSVVFLCWKKISACLDKCGELWLVSALLHVVLIFHVIPVVFLWLVLWTRAFHAREAGGILGATPSLVRSAKGLAVVWLCGFLLEVVRYLAQQRAIRISKRISKPGGPRSKAAVRTVKERLHIKKEIPVYELSNCRYPMITGFLNCCIFIPEKIEDEREMEMILEHEFYHYVRKDLRRKKLCAWIVRLQWFNPLAHRLAGEVDIWGDSLCDYHMCYESERHWSMKEYFLMVINYAERKEEKSLYSGMHLSGNGEVIIGRIDRMKNMKTRKGMRRSSVLLLAICFAAASSITSFAAGGGIEALFRSAFEASVAVSYGEELTAESDLEEYTRNRSDYEGRIEIDEDANPNARGTSSYNWDVRAGKIYETGLFWATKGDKIGVSVTPSPLSSKIGMGLDQPNGVMRGVSGTGPMSHTFTVEQTGFHRVFVENMESTQISVAVGVSR